MAKSHCHAKYLSTGIKAESLSGTTTPPVHICQIGRRTDIEHQVNVRNRRLYDAEVQCSATILNQRGCCVHFEPGATASWNGATVVVAQYRTHGFNRGLGSSGQGGKETIRVLVDVLWPLTNQTDRFTLDIDVKA